MMKTNQGIQVAIISLVTDHTIWLQDIIILPIMCHGVGVGGGDIDKCHVSFD